MTDLIGFNVLLASKIGLSEAVVIENIAKRMKASGHFDSLDSLENFFWYYNPELLWAILDSLQEQKLIIWEHKDNVVLHLTLLAERLINNAYNENKFKSYLEV